MVGRVSVAAPSTSQACVLAACVSFVYQYQVSERACLTLWSRMHGGRLRLAGQSVGSLLDNVRNRDADETGRMLWISIGCCGG